MFLNAFDFLIIALLLYFIATNAAKGAKEDILGFPGYLVGFVFGLAAMEKMGNILSSKLPLFPSLAKIFSLVFVIISFRIFLQLMVQFLEKSITEEVLTLIFKVVGGFFGFIKGAFLTSVILILILLLPFGGKFKRSQTGSKFLEPICRFAPALVERVVSMAPGGADLLNDLVSEIENSQKPDP